MSGLRLPIRFRMDRAGVMLSGLCALHCLASIVLVSVLGIGSQALLSPAIHEVGLALAIVIGAVTLGIGVVRHGRIGNFAIGALGIVLMTTGLMVGHGLQEAAFTIAGVTLVAAAHIRNLRRAG